MLSNPSADLLASVLIADWLRSVICSVFWECSLQSLQLPRCHQSVGHLEMAYCFFCPGGHLKALLQVTGSAPSSSRFPVRLTAPLFSSLAGQSRSRGLCRAASFFCLPCGWVLLSSMPTSWSVFYFCSRISLDSIEPGFTLCTVRISVCSKFNLAIKNV